MEEEDGRPGARATQTGPSNAPCGVPTLSLPINLHQTVILSAAKDLLFQSPAPKDLFQNEEKNENVPGK